MTDGRRVSVVIPTLNAGARLRRCLESVWAQGDLVTEVLLVDGGSTDGSLDDLGDGPAAGRLRLLGGTGVSLIDAWNLGIEHARGDWVAFIDTDDVWLPDALTSQLDAVDADPVAAAVTGRVRYVVDGVAPSTFRTGLADATPVGWMPGTTMVRVQTARAVGPFDPAYGVASDIEWVARLRARVPVAINENVVLDKAVRADSVSMAASEPADGSSAYARDLVRLLRDRVRARATD